MSDDPTFEAATALIESWPPLLAAAYVAAQGEMEAIEKDRTASVTSTRTGGTYTYTYADLATVLGMARPILAKNGLAVMQEPIVRQSNIDVFTTLVHSSGECKTFGPITFGRGDSPQALGSAITYARRYAMLSVLGLATEDDDGHGARGREGGESRSEGRSGSSGGSAPRKAQNAAKKAPPRKAAATPAAPAPQHLTLAQFLDLGVDQARGWIGAVMDAITDIERRKTVKTNFVDTFKGAPGALTLDQLADAHAWLTTVGLVRPDPVELPTDDTPGDDDTPDEGPHDIDYT